MLLLAIQPRIKFSTPRQHSEGTLRTRGKREIAQLLYCLHNQCVAEDIEIALGRANRDMLDDDEKARIRQEEIFRSEIRREIEASKPKKRLSARVWTCLNSSFALWF